MTRLRAYRVDALIAAGFVILPLLLYWQVTLGGRTMLPADNLFQWAPWAANAAELGVDRPHNGLLSDLILENYPWKRFIDQNVSARQIPLWNPNLFGGTPFLATGQHSAYYPFSALFLVVPLAAAFGWFTVSQLWLAGIFAYAFGRVLGMRRSSALAMGLVFQGSGFLVVSSAVFPMILAAAVWLPLLLACVEKIIGEAGGAAGTGRTLPWALVGAVALGFQVLAGHIEITYYTLLVMAFYAVWRLAGRAHALWRAQRRSAGLGRPRHPYLPVARPAAWLLAMVVLGLMIGAIQLVPFVEVGRANFREGSASLAEIRGWAFPPRRALTLAMPDFFGNPADHAYFDVFAWESVPFTTNAAGEVNPHSAYSSDWGIKNYVEGGIYLGILPLLLAVVGVWSAVRLRRDRRATIAFMAVLALLSLAFIFGTPLYAILYYGLPGINQLHSPFRWVFPLSLAVAALAGYGLDHLLASVFAHPHRGRSAGPAPIVGRLATLGAPGTAAGALGGAAFWAGVGLLGGLAISRLAYGRLEGALNRIFLGLERAPDAFPSVRAFYCHEFEQLLILALLLIASGLVLRLSRHVGDRGGRPWWTGAAVLLTGLDLLVAGYGFNAAADPALLAYRPALLDWLAEQPGEWRLTTFAPHGDKPLNANTPWLADLADVRGYDSVILKQYTDYMAAIEPQEELPFNRVQPIRAWESLNSPLLDLLGVRYVVTAETIDLPKYTPVFNADGLNVYENAAAVARAYTLPATATLIVEEPLAALVTFDPRQYVVVAAADWAAGNVAGEARPGTLAPAEIVAYENVEVRVRAEVAEPSWLVLNDTYFTGWDAFAGRLDESGLAAAESQVEVVRVNGNFRGVLLEPGVWEVRFRYSPLSFKLGGLITFMGGIVLLFSLAVWQWRRLYNPSGPLTVTRSVAKNSLAPMSLNLFNRLIDFGFAAFYLRVLGPGDAGRFATAIIIAGWFEIVSNWGLNTFLIREVSRERSRASHYLLNSSVLRLGTSAVASLPILAYLAAAGPGGGGLDRETAAAVLLLMSGMLFSGMSQGLAGLYYAYETAEFPAFVTTITTILKVAFGVLALLLGYGFVGLAAVSIAVNVITLAILAAAAFRHFQLGGPWRVDLRLQRLMLTLSYPLMLNHLLAVIFFQIDVPLMNQINGAAVVGWYNSAYKWVLAFNVIPSFFTIALFPVISRQALDAPEDARRTFRLSIKLMLLIALPLAVVTTLLAPFMIGVLGGREFLPAGAIALQILIWSIPFGWINSVTNYVLIAHGREKMLTVAFAIGVTFNVVANLLLLPSYSYVAAAAITIFSELVLLALFAYFLRPAMPGVGWLNLLARPAGLTAAMAAAMIAGSQLHWLVGLALALGVYAAGVWKLSILSPGERRLLGTLLPTRLAARLAVARPQAEG